MGEEGRGGSGSGGGSGGGSERDRLAAQSRAEAAAASRLAAELASVSTSGPAAVPAELPEQQMSHRNLHLTIANGDPAEAMRPKAAIRDVRTDVLSHIESRGENPRLPVHHTSMVLPYGDDPDEHDADHGQGIDNRFVRAPAAYGNRPEVFIGL